MAKKNLQLTLLPEAPKPVDQQIMDKVPKPEAPYMYIDHDISRTPMAVLMGWTKSGELIIQITAKPVARPPDKLLLGAIQFHTEKLNMNLSVIAEETLREDEP